MDRREYMKKYNKAYWKKNKVLLEEKNKERYEKNRTAALKYAKTYRQKKRKKIKGYLHEWHRRRYAENKQFILEYLQMHPCVDCGETDTIVLDFDHVRGKKSFCITTVMMSSSLKRIIQEIAKCDVRCANCHRKRHAKSRRSAR